MRVPVTQRICLLSLMAAFTAIGVLRINDCDLFNPDSPRYVIYSQAIVNLGEYRATDLPGSPLYSWRPPGLSLLLAPILALRPYDVVAAKLAVLSISVCLIAVLFRLGTLHSSGWSALLMATVVATNPAFLVLSTEVLTEVPYTLGSLLVISILARVAENNSLPNENQTQRPPWLPLIGVTVALAYTPWLRTAGVALVIAVGIWSLLSRIRLCWLLSFAISVAGLGLLAWRNSQAKGENYVGSLFGRIRERGVVPLIASGFDAVSFYVSSAAGLILPGFSSDRPFYGPLTLASLPTLGWHRFAATALAVAVAVLGLLGMWRRRARGGSLALLYLIVYGGCLAVWPWRHERFLWPVIPVVCAFLPVGWAAIVNAIGIGIGRRTLFAFGSFLAICLCGWQAYHSESLVEVNQRFVGDRAEFYASQWPGFYFSNWRRAGSWLDANSPPHARVLTWHAAVGETSHRFQKRVAFETLTPDKIRQQIENFSARYLVVPSAQAGDGFGWQQLAGDPNLQLEVCYHEQDVAVLEIVPNRTGIVSQTAYPEWLDQQLQRIDDTMLRLPGRSDLAVRRASLLRELGRDEEAAQALRNLHANGIVTVRVCTDLGWILFDREEFADAAKFLELARTLPNSESIADQLIDGAKRARQRLHESTKEASSHRLGRRLHRARSLLSNQKYLAAERELGILLESDPNHVEVSFLRGQLHHLLGQTDQAEQRYEQSIKLGNTDSARWLRLIRYQQAMSMVSPAEIEVGGKVETIESTDPACHLRLAELFRELGWAGQGLAVLEQAFHRFPEDHAIQCRLADFYLQFARPELATPLYDSVLRQTPDSAPARQGLHTANGALRIPKMSPNRKD